MSAIRFKLTAYTDPAGKWNETAPKKGNEDDLFVDADLTNGVQGEFVSDKIQDLSDAGCLMVIADGMGGMNAGEVASSIAIDTVKTSFAYHNLSPDIMTSSKSRMKYMEKVVVDADSAIKGRARVDRECEGMGSTIIIAWLYGNELSVTWCGDSRAYIFREAEGIRQISKDHSYVQSLIDQGSLTEAAAFDHPYGNIITRSLGDPDKKAVPDSITVPIYKGDVILLCSDGLNGVLRDKKTYDEEGNLYPGENIEDIIKNNRETMTDCRLALWKAAERADWYDNVTAVLCQIVEGEEFEFSTSGLNSAQGTLSQSVPDTNSFIKIRKTTLKKLAIVFMVVLFVVIGILIALPRLIKRDNGYAERWTILYDEVRKDGYAAIEKQLLAVEDSLNMELLDRIVEEFCLRKELIDTLAVRVDKSEYPETFIRLLEYIKTSDTVSVAAIPFKRNDSTIQDAEESEESVIAKEREVKVKDKNKDKYKSEANEESDIIQQQEILDKTEKDDDPNLTEVTDGENTVDDIKFMMLSHVAEPKVGLDSISRKYCNKTYPRMALLEKQSYNIVKSSNIQKEKEYYVVIFSANDFDALCAAIRSCNGRLNGGLMPEGFDSKKFCKEGYIEWASLPENEEYTISLK